MSKELTEQQQKHLDVLIERVTQRTAKSKSFTQEHRKVLADPRVVSGFRPQWKEMVYSIVTDRSKGSRIWDIDGNEYIDLVNGFGPIMLGHRPDFVEKAIEAQLHEGFETGPQTPLAGEVAKMFCEMTGNERMAFCNTGSEAVLAALRVSRTVTGRNKVVMFTGDYHGMFDEVLVKGFKNKAGEPQSVPIAPGIPRQSVSNMIVLDYGTERIAGMDTSECERSCRGARRTGAEPSSRPAAGRIPEGTSQDHRGIRHGAHLRRGRYRISCSPGRLPGAVRNSRRSCHLRKGRRRRHADRHSRRQERDSWTPSTAACGSSGTIPIPKSASPSSPAHSFVIRSRVAAMKAVLQHFKEQGPALAGAPERADGRAGPNAQRNRRAGRRSDAYREFRKLLLFQLSSGGAVCQPVLFLSARQGHPRSRRFPVLPDDGAQRCGHRERSFEPSRKARSKCGRPGSSTRREQEMRAVLAPAAEIAGREEAREAPVTESQLEVWLSDQLGEEASCSYNESVLAAFARKRQ